MPLQNFHALAVNLHLTSALHAGTLKSQIKPTYTCEQADESHESKSLIVIVDG